MQRRRNIIARARDSSENAGAGVEKLLPLNLKRL
jgi:hypothetical protein